jgi:hypothetical protein
MEFSGWVFLLASCLSVTVLTCWCFYRVLSLPSGEEVEEEFHAPLDIDTHEQE